jgi:hypothetical protein
MNLFAVADISAVTAPVLSNYQVAILGDMTLTPGQVSLLSTWVASGGNLIAMHPDKQLANLLGLTPSTGILTDAYLTVNASSPPGTGITSAAMEFHGPADLYTLNGATMVASLTGIGSNGSALLPLANPAVTIRTVLNGGMVGAFTFDLARSVSMSRQGNPAWSGENRTGYTPTRADDLFYGSSVQFLFKPDWNSVQAAQVQIPFADEEQRLLANMIQLMAGTKMPLPHFWYLPFGKKAVVLMTGDDHAEGGTKPRFDSFLALSAAGCSVANWDWNCPRMSSNIFPGQLSNSDAVKYTSLGFEITQHTNHLCKDYTFASLQNTYATELANFAVSLPGIPAPSTNRTHCVTWSDYDSQPQVQFMNGIRLDETYYYYPPGWSANPGYFTGSGLPQRFTKMDGTMVDVYQAPSQITDESEQDIPTTISTLLNNAVGTRGYYGVITANMHTDTATSTGSDQIMSQARTMNISVVSALQVLNWLDGRNSSVFGGLNWSGNTLTFTVTASPKATGLEALLPANSPTGPLTALFLNGSPISFASNTIKGVNYAIFLAPSGTYTAVYGNGQVSVSVAPATMTLTAGQGQQFGATVLGTTQTGVTWSMAPVAGTLSANGYYTAPANIAASQTITITATSQADNTKSAKGTITLNPPPVSVGLSATPTNLGASGVSQLTATVSGSSNTAVTWTVSSTTASFASSGLSATLTAPASIVSSQSVTVTATSVADPTKASSVGITLTPPPPVSVGLSATPTSLGPSGVSQLTATVSGTSNTAVTWTVSSTTASFASSGLSATLTAPASIVSSQSVTVTATSVADPTKAGSVVITLTPPPPVSVGLSATPTSLGPSGVSQLTATVSGTSNTAVTWTVSSTTASFAASGLSATVTAPASIVSSQSVTVTATSVADPTKAGSVVITLTPPPPPVSVVPSGVWSFDPADVNGPYALDRSGNGINGTMQNIALVTGKSGQAASFNGSSSNIVMSNDALMQLSSDLTLVFWMKTTNNSRVEAVISKYDSTGSETGYLIKTTPTGTLGVQLGLNSLVSGTRQVFDTTLINNGAWHHVAVVLKLGQTVTFYVDGQLSSSAPLVTQSSAASASFQLGSIPFTYYGAAFTGTLDQVSVYRKALSASDVTALYTTP